MIIRIGLVCALLTLVACPAVADDAPVITGFRGGKIEWKSKTNEQYRVEWAWKLDGSNTVWSTNWSAPQEVAGTGVTTSASVPAFYRVVKMATHKSLKSPEAWSAYDAAGTSGLNTKGYYGSIFDGRYIYCVPYYDGSGFHGRILRYDIQGGFTNGSSWVAYNAANTDGLDTRGYTGGAFDGRYVYFGPNDKGVRHGLALRYDTEGSFTNNSSWRAYDAGNTDGLVTSGYTGVIYDGRYIYYAPLKNKNGIFHACVLRYDPMGDGFTNSASWSAYDASFTDGMPVRGFLGGTYDGRYVYFAPHRTNNTVFHGCVLRYDTQSNFKNAASWSAYDASNTDALNTVGYYGGVFDGQYVYFIPWYDGTAAHGRVLRYDTKGNGFSDGASWSAYDAGSTDGLATGGYGAGSFDGRYVYFAPDSESGAHHGRVLRYDTQTPFKNSNSWQAYDAGNTDGMTTKGYISATFDGRFVYFCPWRSEVSAAGYHARILRFDSRWPHKLPKETSGGSCF